MPPRMQSALLFAFRAKCSGLAMLTGLIIFTSHCQPVLSAQNSEQRNKEAVSQKNETKETKEKEKKERKGKKKGKQALDLPEPSTEGSGVDGSDRIDPSKPAPSAGATDGSGRIDPLSPVPEPTPPAPQQPPAKKIPGHDGAGRIDPSLPPPEVPVNSEAKEPPAQGKKEKNAKKEKEPGLKLFGKKQKEAGGEKPEPKSSNKKTDVENAKNKKGDAEKGKSKGGAEQAGQRARRALNEVYRGQSPAVSEYVVDLRHGDRQTSDDALAFLEVYLRQSLDDEASLKGKKVLTAVGEQYARTLSSTARNAVYSAIVRAGSSPASLKLVPVLSEDLLATAGGAAAAIVSDVSSPDAVPLYTKLLSKPHTNSQLTPAVLRKIGRDNLQQFAPRVRELAGHYRANVRDAAREAAKSLHIEGIGEYDESKSVTPWLESQINDLAKLQDGREKLNLKSLPPLNPVVRAAAEYVKGDRKTSLRDLFQKLNTLPDDRLLFIATRDEVFLDYYKLAVKEFVDGNTKSAQAIAELLSAPIFAGAPLAGESKSLSSQIAERAADSKNLSLVDEKGWQDLTKRPAKEQIEYLVPRLRLLRGRSISSLGKPLTVDFAPDQSAGKNAINPYAELRKILKEPANIALLFSYVNDNRLTLVLADGPAGVPQLKTIGELVAEAMNESAKYDLIGRRYFFLNQKEQGDYLAKQEKFYKQNVNASAKELNYALAAATSDPRVFSMQCAILLDAKDNRLGALLCRRFDDFPESAEYTAELLFKAGGPDAVKKAESVLKQAPPVISLTRLESPSVSSAKLRPSVVRFWSTLLLLREKNSAGMEEAKRLYSLPVGELPPVVRQNLPVLIEELLKLKTPEAQNLAGAFVDKMAEKLSPDTAQVLDAGKVLFLYAAPGSYERLVKWLEDQPVRQEVVVRLESWVTGKPVVPYNASSLQSTMVTIKTKLQEEYALLKEGKPSSLKL
jgi:hypothetical protein